MKDFRTESDMKTPIVKHSEQNKKKMLLKKETELELRISKQKMKISEDIFTIKQKEYREKGNCKSRGTLCENSPLVLR